MRVKAGVVLLCVSAVVYAVEICRRNHILTKAPPDAVTLHEMRLAGLRDRLPARGVVGYVSDVQDGPGTNEGWRRYATTQYVLAPLGVDWTAERELVVGDFKDPDAAPAVAARESLILVEDFGRGVLLFRRGVR